MIPKRPHRLLFLSLVVAGFVLDLGTKYGMFRTLWNPTGEGRIEVIPGAFRFIAQFRDVEPAESDWRAGLQRLNSPVLPRVNQGALFGVGNDFQVHANLFFAIVSFVAAGAIIAWRNLRPASHDKLLTIALGMILGGTLGNLFDRIVFHGVRDFLYFYWFEWPVFNVADSLLVCGAGLLLLHAFLTPRPHPTPEPTGRQYVPPQREMATTK